MAKGENDLRPIWRQMKRRCFDTKCSDYSRYGGRGITVCKRWLNFDNFLEDMGLPENNMTIDRVDVNGDYNPNNCKWATRKEQANNRRSNTRITVDGISKNLTQWIEYYGLKGSTVRQRYYVYKWNIKDCLEIRG